ncbi:MAG: MFS transporter [Rhodothalassiaceae bacterium]
MRPVIFSIAALLLSAALLQLGNGLQFTILPIRADMEGFGSGLIALLGSGYFAGFLLGCILGAPLIGRVGHIRVLAAVLSGVGALVLLYPLVIDGAVWFLLRSLTGLCLAIAYMTIESWLNERAPGQMRGTILAVYSLIGMVSLAIGQLLLAGWPVTGFELFSLAAITAGIAALPVTLTRAPAPVPVPQPRLRIKSLLKVSRVAVVGSASVGIVNSAFWTFGPIHAARSGLGPVETGWFMAAALLGGAVSILPIGRLSDRLDRRIVVALTSLACAMAGLALAFFTHAPLGLKLMLSFLFGGAAFTIQPVCVAHANDHVGARDYVQTAGGLLFLFGASSMLGPLAVAGLIDRFGAHALFVFTAVIHAIGAMAVLVLIRLRPPPAQAGKEEFQAIPRTTLAALQMHEPKGQETPEG